MGYGQFQIRIFCLLALRPMVKRASPGPASFSGYCDDVGRLPSFRKMGVEYMCVSSIRHGLPDRIKLLRHGKREPELPRGRPEGPAVRRLPAQLIRVRTGSMRSPDRLLPRPRHGARPRPTAAGKRAARPPQPLRSVGTLPASATPPREEGRRRGGPRRRLAALTASPELR
jgi:hypothetical protein